MTQTQINELKNSYVWAELNNRFGWNTDVAGNSYNADGISATYENVLNILGMPVPIITEALVREFLDDVSEDPDEFAPLSDYIDEEPS